MKFNITQSIIEEHAKFSQNLEDAIQERLDILYDIFGEKFVDDKFGAVICSQPIKVTDHYVRWTWEERWSYGGYRKHDGSFPLELLCSEEKFNLFISDEKNKIAIAEQVKNDPCVYFGVDI